VSSPKKKRTPTVRRNVLANYVGSAATYILSFIFAPIYIRLLGAEAYGLIGFFASIQAVIAIADLGMSATLTRELARRSVGEIGSEETKNLLFSLEVVYFTIGATGAIVLGALSPYFASHWIHYQELEYHVVLTSLLIMALTFALRWCSSLYIAGLVGLQRQVLVNALEVGMAILQYAGVILVLGVAKASVTTFFLYQAALGLLTTLFGRTLLWKSLPRYGNRPRWDRARLAEIKGFAAGVTAISITSIIILQADRIILSRLLPLGVFGYYTFAANAAGILSRVVRPVNQAVAPRINQLVALDDARTLKRFYSLSSQMIAVSVLPVTAVLVALAPQLLMIWTRNQLLTDNVTMVFRILIVGNALNALMYIPFTLQLAYGWTSLTVIINCVWIVLFVPGIFVANMALGIAGVAGLWVALNLIQIIVLVQIMHRRLHPAWKWEWYRNSVASPMLVSAAGGACSLIGRGSTLTVLLTAVAASLATLACSVMILPELRQLSVATWKRFYSK
jgi:O-antigen/teichoic acid export membrane protein